MERLEKLIEKFQLSVSKLINQIPPPYKVIGIILVYSCLIVVSRYLAFLIRFDFNIPKELSWDAHVGWIYELPLKLGLLSFFGQFNIMLSYFSFPDLKRIFYATTLSAFILWFIRYLPIGVVVPPRSVVLLDWILLTGGICFARLLFRRFREWVKQPIFSQTIRRSAVIIGAGDTGAELAKELINKPQQGLIPVGFLDDDKKKWGRSIHGIRVYGPPTKTRLLELKIRFGVSLVILALPSAPAGRVKELVKLCRELKLEHYTVPSWFQLVTGKVHVSKIRPIQIEDILNREQVNIDLEKIRNMIDHKTILVTGAGGSIGSELCRQIIRFNPACLVLLDHSEYLLFKISQELGMYNNVIHPVVGNIVDKFRIEKIFEKYKPDYVFHAAAYKHVPIMETNIEEAIKVNLIGTSYVADAALANQTKGFVLISTDKAIKPVSVMGATKRAAELYIQSLYHANSTCNTKFMAVRFGNVLGSSGSVVEVFNQQIAEGGPVTVTHPKMKRYFMSIPEAVGLILHSAFMGEGGEIFMLNMGEPVYILDLAKQMIELSGFRPEVDIQIKIVGPRPGEKLEEELRYDEEICESTDHPHILKVKSQAPDYILVKNLISELEQILWNGSDCDLKKKLKELVPEYVPSETIGIRNENIS